MLIFIFLVFLSSNFLFIKSEDNGNLTIVITNENDNCSTKFAGYTLTEGHSVTLVPEPEMFVNYGFWRHVTASGTKNLSDKLNHTHTVKVEKAMEGIWEFEFYYYGENYNYKQNKTKKPMNGANYTTSVCRTNVTIVPDKDKSAGNRTIIESVLGTVAIFIILGQTAYIIFLRAETKRLKTDDNYKNLSKRADPVDYPNDTARYCSNPGQKNMEIAAPVDDDDDPDNDIYEAPNMVLTANGRMPTRPPQPPDIDTMPRTPRPDHNMRVDHQAMLASALNSPARSPMIDNNPPSFPRPKHIEREPNVMNRPPLPLPVHPQDHVHEVYEEMDAEENTYEPPPIINTMPMPSRRPVPTKKVVTSPPRHLDVKQNTAKPRFAGKPAVTSKPQGPRSNTMTSANELEQAFKRRNNETKPKVSSQAHTGTQQQALRRRNNDANPFELEEALRRRNNVQQVPMVSIPDPASRGTPASRPIQQVPIASIPDPASRAPASRPRPAVKSKPRGPPIPQPVQEEIYYNQPEESSDEEWTYEPLKPLNINTYDDSNLYNNAN